MRKSRLWAAGILALYIGAANAQFPVLDEIAAKVVQKYQSSTCEQLWIQKSQKKPPTDKEKNLIAILQQNPQMRTEFINKVAAPVVNKMFECGMIP